MKKLFGIIAVAAIVAAAGWNFSQKLNAPEFSDLALANIEALANPEMGDGKEFHEKTGCYLNCSPSATCRDRNGQNQTAASSSKCSCGEHEY